MSTQRSRRRTRRLHPWTSPLTEIPESDFTSNATHSRSSSHRADRDESPTRRMSNRSILQVSAAAPPPPNAASAGRRRTTATSNLSSNLRQLRNTISERKRAVAFDRLYARHAVQDARDLQNQVHSTLQNHFLCVDEPTTEAFNSSSSSLSLSSVGDEEEEELNRFLRDFLNNLIEEASPIHS